MYDTCSNKKTILTNTQILEYLHNKLKNACLLSEVCSNMNNSFYHPTQSIQSNELHKNLPKELSA